MTTIYDFHSQCYYEVVAVELFNGGRPSLGEADVVFLQRLPRQGAPFPVPKRALDEAFLERMVTLCPASKGRLRPPKQSLSSFRRGVGPAFAQLRANEYPLQFEELLTGLQTFAGQAAKYGLRPKPNTSVASKRARASKS